MAAVTEVAVSHRAPQELGVSLWGCSGACYTQNALSILCFVWGSGMQLRKRFCVVKILKNILHSIDICVFLSHTGKNRVVLPWVELGYWIALLGFAHGLLTLWSGFSVFLCRVYSMQCPRAPGNLSLVLQPHGELLLILVKSLCVEQLHFIVLKKTCHDQGSLIGLNHPCCSFRPSYSHYPQQEEQHFTEVGRSQGLKCFPEPLVASFVLCGALGSSRRVMNAGTDTCPGVTSP